MVFNFILLLYTIVLSFSYGACVLIVINKLLHNEDHKRVPFSMVIVAGTVLITTIIAFLSLFIKIDLIANLIILFIGLSFFIINRNLIYNLVVQYLDSLKATHNFVLISGALLFIFILMFSTFVPLNYDTYLYHAQSIKWIENYRVVPGLGNLHGRLAYNSSWFLTSALFDLSFLQMKTTPILSEYLLVVIGTYFLGGIDSLMKKELSPNNWFKAVSILLIIYLYVSWMWVASPTNDAPSIVLSLFIFAILLDRAVIYNKYSFDTESVLLMIISIFLLTVKLSMVTFLLLPAYYLIREFIRKNTRRSIIVLIVGSVILCPFLIRNIVLSGYLVYPYPALDLFNFDWKIPIGKAISEKTSIENSARLLQDYPNILSKMSFFDWVIFWYNKQIFPTRIMLASIMFLTVSIFIILISKINSIRNVLINEMEYVVLHLLAFIGTLYWFVTAPDPRFGYGFIFTLFFLLSSQVIKKYKLTSIVAIVFLSFFNLHAIIIAYKSLENHYEQYIDTSRPLDKRILLPNGYRENFVLREDTLRGFICYMPTVGDQTGNSPLPSTPYLDEKLKMRGESLGDGFKMSNENK